MNGTMKKFKGTKGEWMIKPLMDGDRHIKIMFNDWHKNVPDISLRLQDIEEEQKANAKLIAAAPELLEAVLYYFDVLKEVRGSNWAENPDHVLAKMINATKKAL